MVFIGLDFKKSGKKNDGDQAGICIYFGKDSQWNDSYSIKGCNRNECELAVTLQTLKVAIGAKFEKLQVISGEFYDQGDNVRN
jgi:hypothetical protein